jgi:PAS domain S-box-containing protein
MNESSARGRMLRHRGRKQREIKAGMVLVAVYLVIPLALTAQTNPDRPVLVNDLHTLWAPYKWYIIGGVALILAQAALVIQLLLLRARQRMQQALVVANDRLRMSLECGRSVGWDWDVKTGRDYWFGDLKSMFGIASETYLGGVEDFHQRIHPEDRELVARAVAHAKQNRSTYTADFRVVRTDGSVRWVTARGKFYYDADNTAVRMLGMAADITERKQAEEALKKSEEKFSKAFQQSPISLTITTALDKRYVEVNQTFLEMTGWQRDEVVGRTPNDVGLLAESETGADIEKQLLSGELVRNHEFKLRARNGEVRTGLGSAEFIEIDGQQCVLSVTMDITEWKRAEATLRESEERFRLVANTAPMMIWMSGVDKLCNYFNSTWLEFTGRPLEAELGNGWAEGVHSEDLRRCFETYSQAFDQRKAFQMEYRIRRHDGEYRWIFDHGVPRYNDDGSFAGYIGTALDVTDRKAAEEALSMISRQLIKAQEEERAWIARELHDDVCQRLIALMLNLENLRRMPSSQGEVRNALNKAILQASNLSSDLQSLSHRLHSSKLEYLGLANAVTAYCNEVSYQHQLQIDLHSENIPKDISPEISLCIFRVLQEALQNAVKHSGSKRYEVSLDCRASEIVMLVRDFGVGFDPQQALLGHGLGLTSMKERLKLVQGELVVESQPRKGTTIQARVQLTPKGRSAHASAR